MTNFISSAFGSFASKKFPSSVQRVLNRSYAKAFKLDMSEFDSIENFASLNLLFTRKLLKQRQFDESAKTIISPCDARITEFGLLSGIELLQIKGKSYSLDELLTSSEEASNYKNGLFANFYLSPRDYHRFHAPVDLRVIKTLHVPGKLYPVNTPALNSINALFAKNERVLMLCEDTNGKRFYMIFIGALNVGRIVMSFDDRVQTNANKKTISTYTYENTTLRKGDEIGMFEMGSSVVMVFEKEYLDFDLSYDQKVRFGQTIATIR